MLFEGVKDVLSAVASPATVAQGQTVTFSGTVSPDHTGHVIYLEARDPAGTGFRVVDLASIGQGSAYSIAYAPYQTGSQVFRVRIPGGPDNEGAVSQTFTIVVTPAPAAALTPQSTGNSSMPAEGQV